MIGGGELLFGGEVTLAGPGEGQNSYDTPWLFGSYGDGLNEIAARFHSYVRSLHPRLFSHGRPVILNTWEAVYFDHNFDTLKALADKAADSGVERFVVDDGWFGSRRDDTSGLGDWQIAQDVWPDGPKSLKRSPTTCTPRVWNSACGSSRKWSTPIPMWPVTTLIGFSRPPLADCRCRAALSRCSI